MKENLAKEIGDEQLLTVMLAELEEFNDSQEIHDKILDINKRAKVFNTYFNREFDYIFPEIVSGAQSGLVNYYLRVLERPGELIRRENGRYKVSEKLIEIANEIKKKYQGNPKLKILLESLER